MALGERPQQRAPGRTPRRRGTSTRRTSTAPAPHLVDNPRPPRGTARPEVPGRPPRRRTPAKTRSRSPDLTPHEPHRVAPSDHQPPHRGRRVHPHEGKGIHPHREAPKTPPNPPPHPNRQATTLATARATTLTQRHGRRRGKGTRPGHQGRKTTQRQRDRTGGDPTQPRGPRHPTPQNPAHP